MGQGDEDDETGQDGGVDAVENHSFGEGEDSGHQVPVAREKELVDYFHLSSSFQYVSYFIAISSNTSSLRALVYSVVIKPRSTDVDVWVSGMVRIRNSKLSNLLEPSILW